MKVFDDTESCQLPYPSFPYPAGEIAGDSSGDIYHFWSAMIYRDLTGSSTRYGSYSSGGVISGDLTQPRIHVEASPMVSDGWGARNLVMHNLSVVPGSILLEGEPFTPAAYYLPLPDSSTLEFIITPPAGNQRTITVQGDSRGYASAMGERFNLDSPGIWNVMAKITQGDQTGGILGIETGQPWSFYVMPGIVPLPVKFHLPAQYTMPADEPLALTADLTGADVASGKAYITVTFNGAVLEQTERDILNSSFVYSIDTAHVPDSFPNFSLDDPHDRLVITFLIDGLSAAGQHRMAARMIYSQGNVLYAGDPQEGGGLQPQTREQRLRELTEGAAQQ
jgi:hypothetical protein